jgi:ribosomal protein S15P/S13E
MVSLRRSAPDRSLSWIRMVSLRRRAESRTRPRSQPSCARTSAQMRAVVVAPPVDWTELARRVAKVVSDFQVDRNDEESKKALLDLVRSLLQLLTLRSGGARGSAGGVGRQ